MSQFNSSKVLWEQSKDSLVSGVSSTLRATMKPVPLFIDRGKGSRIWDVSGNELIDYIMGYGPLILGHSHKEHLNAISEQMKKGQQYGMQHNGEIKLSQKIVDLVPSVEKIAFSGSGTEAVMLALRLARAYTGRQKVVRFEGHYHGWSDGIFTSFQTSDKASSNNSKAGTAGQSIKALEDIIVIPWNDFEAFNDVINKYGNDIAAVINEPVMCNSGCIYPKKGYLEHLRNVTKEKNIVYIFDEVITGFRVGPGGAQEHLGILPDLVTMGKALAGGIQLSAVGGKQDIMDLISDGTVPHLGTLNGNVIAISAAIATLDILNRDGGKAYKHLEQISNQLVQGINKILEEHNISHVINQFGSVFNVMFTNEREVVSFEQYAQRDSQRYVTLSEEMLKQGVAIRPNGLWYVSLAHTVKDVEDTLSIMQSIVRNKL